MKNSKVLVTGSRGFIGTALRRTLRDLGANVVGVGRSAPDDRVESEEYFSADLSDADATQRLFQLVRPDYVVHLAGCSIARREPEWVNKTLESNLLTTVNVLTAGLGTGVMKTVIAGSLEEPDDQGSYSVPSSPYAASKWAASGYARMFHSLYDLSVATARIFMVYGVGQQELQKLVPYVCLSAIDGRPPELMSGTRMVDWIYVDDVAEGLARMLSHGPVDGAHVDIGTGQAVSTGDVARKICQLAGGAATPKIGAIPDRVMEQVRVANVEHTRAAIGWQPAVSLDEGLARTLEWCGNLRAGS